MADKDKHKKMKQRRAKRMAKTMVSRDDFGNASAQKQRDSGFGMSMKAPKKNTLDEWDTYNPSKEDKHKDRDKKKDKKDRKKKHKHKEKDRDNDKSKESGNNNDENNIDPTKMFRRQKSSRDKHKKSKRKNSKLETSTINENGASDDDFGEIKNKAKITIKSKKDKRDSGFGKLPSMKQKSIDFDDTNIDKEKDKKRKHRRDKKEKSASPPNDNNNNNDESSLDDIQKEKERLKQQRIEKLKKLRAQNEAEKEEAAKKLHKKDKRKKRRSRGFNKDEMPKSEESLAAKQKKENEEIKKQEIKKQETTEERKARKEREKKERMERLKRIRLQHQDEQKKTQQELEAFIKKRDGKRYSHPYNEYPADKETVKQLIYKSLREKVLCPIPKFKYDPNKKDVEPILNAFGLSITHMDCLVAYYMIDIEWNGYITKKEYINCIKNLLQIKEWNDEKINIVWNNLLLSKDITKQIYNEYKEDEEDDIMKYDIIDSNKLTLIDFINGLNLTSKISAIYDFYYLLLGGHYYDDTLAQEDDWHGDFTQKVLWLKQFGDKTNILFDIDNGNSYLGATHGLLEYHAIICSLLNPDFIPTLEKHPSEIVSKFTYFISHTIGNIKSFKYEWFQAEVMIGAGKLCILRSDITYCSMKPINIILKECDRLLTMLESKVLVQLAMHLMKVVVIHCPSKQQDLLLKELSGLITHNSFRNRPFVPLQQLLLLLLVAIDRYNIQNSKTWQKMAPVALFACNHEKQAISDLGEEVLWRIYMFSPSVGEDVLSNKMEKKKAKQVRKALGIEKYWEQQQKQRSEMKTIKLYQEYDSIPNHWKKLTYNPALNDMSPARLWSMMQKIVYGDIDLLDEHPSMNYDDFVRGLSECQTYLRSASVRALFQCLPRQHRPWVTKQEFIDFICNDNHIAPNRRHYALRIKELLTIIEDKWKTAEAEKKRIAEAKAREREEARLKRKAEREEKKRLKEEQRRQKEIARKEREAARKQKALARQEAARLKKEEEEQAALKAAEEEAERKLQEEKEREKAEQEAKEKKDKKDKKKRRKKDKPELQNQGSVVVHDDNNNDDDDDDDDDKETNKKKKKRKKKDKDGNKKKKKTKVPGLDTSIGALQEDTEKVVVERRNSSSSKKNDSKSREHKKTKTREEQVMQDLVALLDFGDEDDSWDEDADGFKVVDYDKNKRGSDEESQISTAENFGALRGNHPPKTPYFGKRNSTSSSTVNSALNTPTFAGAKSMMTSGFDTPDLDKRGGHLPYQTSWGGDDAFSVMDQILGDMGVSVPVVGEDRAMSVVGDDIYNDDGTGKPLKKLCGIDIREIIKLNRDDVYDQRSVILFNEEELAVKFKKKMGKEFCLNAAATKLIFVAGLQDRGCTLDNEQLNIVHYGVEQFLPAVEYDLPSAIAQWILHDETLEDKSSRKYRDDKNWQTSKSHLPTYLKHELIAFIFGETYFDLTDPQNKNKTQNKRRKKGEPVIHRNINYVGSCVEELHNMNLPKKKYEKLIWGFARDSLGVGDSRIESVSKSLLWCISFYTPLSNELPDDDGNLVISSLILDRTFHPEKLNASQGYNEYDNIHVKRTGRVTGIPYEHETGNGGVLLLKVYGTLFIERHATVDVDSCGYSGGWHYNSQGDSIYRCGKTSRYANFGGGGGGYYAGGGGYGTRGNTPKSDNRDLLKIGEGGKTYGDRLVHLNAYMGSGGGAGGGNFLYSRGGRGGGIVCIIAGCIHNKGRIMSLGQRGRYLAGSGSGGSIIIECNSYYHYGKGAILASSLEPYPDVQKKQSGGIGGSGRVAIKVNRQKWTTEMRKAICTNDIQQIWTPSAWIYPIPKWVSPDKGNKRSHLKPKLIGFHPMSRTFDTVYKNCTIFRNDDDGDGALINKYSSFGDLENKELKMYQIRKEKERKALYDWKFEEFSLENDQQSKLKTQKSQYRAFGSSSNMKSTINVHSNNK